MFQCLSQTDLAQFRLTSFKNWIFQLALHQNFGGQSQEGIFDTSAMDLIQPLGIIDTETGHGDANLLDGGGGNDLIYGGFQSDTLDNGLGDDTLPGGQGDD